jgi:membrane protein
MIKKFFTQLFNSIMRHNIGTLASAIAFFLFSSTIPMCLLLIFGASLLISGASVEKFLEEVIQSYFPTIPGGTFVVNTINRLIQVRTTIGIIGLVGLLWTTVGGFVSLQLILDNILEIRNRRSFLFQYVIGFAMLVILLILTVVSASVTALSPQLVSRFTNINATPIVTLIHLIGSLSFPLILFVTCYFCYRVLPSSTMSNIPLLTGSAFSTVSIYVCRELFVVYTHHLGKYELIYGTLTFVMLLTFWIYIVSWIFLLGAEISANIQKTKNET